MAQINDISPEVIEAAVKRVLSTLNGGASAPQETMPSSSSGSSGKLDAKKDYPLSKQRPDLVKSATGLAFKKVDIVAIRDKTNILAF